MNLKILRTKLGDVWRVADPGFPRGGANPGGTHLFFAKNCMKIEKDWTQRGRTSLTPLDPPLMGYTNLHQKTSIDVVAFTGYTARRPHHFSLNYNMPSP